MNWARLSQDNPLIFLQRCVKIVLIRADRRVTRARMAFARVRHRQDFVLKEIQGSRMFLNIRDKGLSSDLYLRGKRENNATDEFQKRLREDMVIVDAGANIGYYALMEAKAVGKKGKVYAIEPIPQNIELLKKNIEANGYGNMEVFQLAVGDKNGRQDIFVSRQSNLSTFCKNPGLDQSGETLSVEVASLDSFLEGKRLPDIVRMDVEGYEYEILRGMGQTMKKDRNMQFFIEIHADFMGREKTIELFRIMKESGFRHCRVVMESPDAFKFAGKIVSKEILPEQGEFDKSIDEMIAEERFHHGVYHLFVEKRA
ncbi:MAG: FkbM family methyltransferase [archaeon]